DFSYSDIHETQWITNIEESQHYEDLINVVDESPFLNVLEDMFDQLVTYDEKSQTADVEELPHLDELLEVERNSNDENIEDSGPLYPIVLGIDFSNWKEEAHIIEGHNKGHHTGNCKFHVNIYRRKNNNLIYITKVDSEHNHKLVENIDMVASHYCKLSPEICNKCKNPTKYIHPRNIYNIVQAIRHEKRVTSDADNYLVCLCWMRPSQQQLWARFFDVVLIDTTAKINKYSMILCVVILIDNHNQSHLVATALLSDETKDTFSWLFESFKKVTSGLVLSLLYTDADLAMIAAAKRVQSTQHVEAYNSIIKSNVNRTLSLLELDHTIERLLVKENQFVNLNDAISKFSMSQEEGYHNWYFKKIDEVCQRFLTPAILKLQQNEMNRSAHYQCNMISLNEETIQQVSIKCLNIVDSTFTKSIRGQHVFTQEIHHEFILKQQWGKGFRIMKKALNLAISTGRAEELYEMHSRLVSEMENEIEINEG
ncbi:5353_t:CDS:2, partial [Scutellospora calospora]